ncbi:hypothetical protein LWI29_021913 [Acer saccharum]|uniref:Uncharacterized protein n=1 Tax=Acer saccharum TaxID=4024 RepID=A0AA39VA30_ACESA|nr:hypothetical protein LWI29_021913 [Acer saccharum]
MENKKLTVTGVEREKQAKLQRMVFKVLGNGTSEAGVEQDDEAVGDKAVVEEDVGGKVAGDKAAVEEDVGGKAAGDKTAIEEDVEEHGDQQNVEEDVKEVVMGNGGYPFDAKKIGQQGNILQLSRLAEVWPTRREENEDYWKGIDNDISKGPRFVPLKDFVGKEDRAEPSSKQLHKNKRKRYHGPDDPIKRRRNFFNASPRMRTTRHVRDRPDLSPPPLDETHSPLCHPSS